MVKNICHQFLILLFVLLSAVTSSAYEFKEGKYEITTSVEMPGMPAGSMPPQTIVHCLTNQVPVPRTGSSMSDCEIKNMEQKGSTYTWEMECVQQGRKMTSQGSITYSENSFKGTSTMNMGPQAGNMTIMSRMSGTRIGDCDDGQ